MKFFEESAAMLFAAESEGSEALEVCLQGSFHGQQKVKG